MAVWVKYDENALELVNISDSGKFGADSFDPPKSLSKSPVRLGWTTAGAVCITLIDAASSHAIGCLFILTRTIPLPKGVDGTKAEVFRKKSDGSFRDMNADYNSGDGSLSFTASVLSVVCSYSQAPVHKKFFILSGI